MGQKKSMGKLECVKEKNQNENQKISWDKSNKTQHTKIKLNGCNKKVLRRKFIALTPMY